MAVVEFDGFIPVMDGGGPGDGVVASNTAKLALGFVGDRDWAMAAR